MGTRSALIWFGVSLLIAALGATLFYLSDSPFEESFCIGVALGTVGVGIFSSLVLWRLLSARPKWVQAIGLVIVLFFASAAVGVGYLLHRGRWLWAAPITRDGWKEDATYLRDLIPRVHPNPFAHVSKLDFESEAARSIDQIPTISEQQVEMSFVRMVASLQDGHSTLFPFQPATHFQMLRLQIYLFSDGWYVIDASPVYQQLRGKRIVSIGGTSMHKAFDTVKPYIGADNEATIEDRAPLYLLCPEVLVALGLAPSAAAITIRVEDDSGKMEETELQPVALLTYLYWYFEPLQPWKRTLPQDNLPLDRQRNWDNYWFRALSDGTVYMAFNQVRDKSDEPFDTFGDRVIRYCEEHNAKRLVIDVRNKSGGDNTIFGGFVEELRKSRMNEPDRLYLLIGRHTFSAAVNFTSAVEGRTGAILVGESAGAGPNHSGDPKRYILPHSKLWVFIASKRHTWGRPDDVRRSHDPSIWVPVSHDDYFGNRDPVLERVLSLQ
jgi:hypothetical protein